MEKHRRNRCPHRSGFTLIEIMIVLFILVLLMGMSVSYLMGTRTKMLRQSTFSYIQTLADAIERYTYDIGSPPTTEQGLAALVDRPNDLPNPAAWVGYIKATATDTDPWRNKYQYACPGTHGEFDIWSCGPDGINGTDDDIGSWMNPSDF